MGLLVPWALLFGLTLPVIILLWLLKRRRQEHEVSSTYLWRQVVRDVRANAPWQRLVANLLLLLQLVAAAAFALALARPNLTGAAAGRAHLIVVLDGSGSMRTATAGGGTRFDLARVDARRRIGTLAPRDRSSIILAGRMPRLLVSAVGPDQAGAAVAAAQPTYEAADWAQALSLAAAAGRDQPGARIVIVTDATVDPTTLTRLGVPAEVATVGEPAENLSVTLSVRPGAGGRAPAALGKVANHGRKQAEAQVDLLADGRLLDGRRVDVPPGGTAEVIWQDLPAATTVFETRLVGDDALAADNRDYAALQRTGRNRALLVSKSNLFLDQALHLREDIEVVRATPDNYAPGPYQLYIFDGWLPAQLPTGALFLVAPPANNLVVPLKAAGPVTGPIRPGARAGALTAYVPLDDVHIARARPLDVPTWANVLLEAPEGPLLAAGHFEGRPVAVLGFDIHESDLPLRVGFPVLMQNLLGWLVPQEASATRVSAGEPVPLALDPLATAATMVTPDARRIPVAPPFPAPPWSDTANPGLYTLVQTLPDGERTSAFVVEFPTAESDPDRTVTLAASPAAGQGASRPPLREVWPWLAAFALAILGVEWWVFIRGT